MPTRRYRFHCTDGHDLVADRRGKRLPNAAQMRRHADRVALVLMEAVPAIHDWSRWQVDVYDAKGRRMMARVFTDVRVDARAA